MTSAKYVKKISLVVVLVLLAGGACGQGTPQSPCPSIFQYQYDGGEWIGVVALSGLKVGQTIRLVINFSLQANLPNNYPGVLDLYYPRDQTLQNIISNKQVLYKVRFPVQNVLPQVEQIVYNNQLICAGQQSAYAGGYSQIRLEHTLQTQLTGQPLAVDSISPSNQLFQGSSPDRDSPIQRQPEKPLPQDEQDQLQYAIQERPQQIPQRPVQPRPQQRPVGRPMTTKAPPVRRKPSMPSATKPPVPNNLDSDTEADYPVSSGNKLAEVNKVCGLVDSKYSVRPLVVGGQEIRRGTWPWLVAIYLNLPTSLSFQCGGNLISHRLVLTSAHCFFGARRYRAQDIVLFTGRYNIRNWNETGAVANNADGLYIHPEYPSKGGLFDADIALVLMTNEVRFSSLIRPVCLWPQPGGLVGSRGVIVGWGRNEAGQEVTTLPKRIEATVVSDLECIRSNEFFRSLTSNRTFCAGDRDGNGPCTGDSGGGFMINSNNRWYVRGIVAASLSDPDKNICDLNEYVIYADVTSFSEWIKSFFLL